MTVRETRLYRDFNALAKLCILNPNIKILERRGEPPDYYRIQISNCKGVQSASIQGVVHYRTQHILVIENFPRNYPDPGQLPTLRVEPLLFHPNIYPTSGIFCLGGYGHDKNHPLDMLVQRAISMIQYANTSFGAPANREAADWYRWASSNGYTFPLEPDSVAAASTPKLNWR